MVFRREIFKELEKDAEDPRITILFGARQVGKTFLLKKLAKEFKDDHYFNLEKSENLRLFNADETEIIELLKSSGSYIFLDEFHYVENIAKIFKIIFDEDAWDGKQDIKIYASGSSALEMHKHIKESLAGRFKKYWIKPLTFSEFSSNPNVDDDLETFLKLGALPGTYDNSMNPNLNDKQDYLQGILDSYIQKDIKSLVAEENIAAFNNLLYMLAANQGQITSSSSLASEIKVSIPTVEKYISILEQTYVLYTLKPFSGNLSNELKKSKKYYFYDLGIRNALLKDFSNWKKRKDKGAIIESYVYHYLLSIAEPSDTDIFFWRTSSKLEIDFVWHKNRKPIPIEVKSKLRKAKVPDAMETFLKAYGDAPFAVVINENLNEVVEVRNKEVHFISYENIEQLEDLLNY